MKIRHLLIPMLLAAAPAFAQAGDFQVRLRNVVVAPAASADIQIAGTHIGGMTKASTSDIPEFDLTYFITDNISAEVIAAVTKHTVSHSVAGRIASTELLPPTITVQYQFDPNGAFRPYVGAGLNYTLFFNNNSALPGLRITNNIGWALQAGMEVPLGDGPYFLNVDVKKIFLATNIRATGVVAPAHLDSWLFGVGVGVRF
jgi:outer membrane protein